MKNYISTHMNVADNCITKMDENNVYHKFCAVCNQTTDKMTLISETGYFDREVTKKCTCGRIVKYQG